MRTLLAIALLALLAGCVTPGATDAAEGIADAAAPPVLEVAEPFAFDGNFGPGAVVCAPVTCVGQSLGNRFVDVDVQGVLTSANLTLTWTAANPLMSKLRLGIGYGEGAQRKYEFVDGPSPLVLSVTDLAVTSDDGPRVFVYLPSAAPGGLLTVHTPQSFHVEGTLGFTPKP